MNARTRRVNPLILTLVVVMLATGCGNGNSRVNDANNDSSIDALAWFDELSRRATQRDVEFVRSQSRTHVISIQPAGKNTLSSDPAVALCDALMFSQPLEMAPTEDAKRVMISVAQYSAGVLGGSAWEYSIDLYRDKDGWKIDSWPYGHRSMSSHTGSPSDLNEK